MTDPKYVGSNNSPDRRSFGLNTWPNPSMLDLTACQTHVSGLSPCYRIFLNRGLGFFTKRQKYWFIKHIWFVLLYKIALTFNCIKWGLSRLQVFKILFFVTYGYSVKRIECTILFSVQARDSSCDQEFLHTVKFSVALQQKTSASFALLNPVHSPNYQSSSKYCTWEALHSSLP
jgi:hypothetical protein